MLRLTTDQPDFGDYLLPGEARRMHPELRVPEEVEAPGLADQPGFSLRLPTGWELRETQPLDSYVGELVGDGVKLRFDYGRFSPSLDPASDPEHIYVLRYEAIGGYEAKLVIPLDASGGLTGVHFRAIDGLRLMPCGVPDQWRHRVDHWGRHDTNCRCAARAELAKVAV